jgi:ABC-type Fe3+ transport system substrate-binding protein
MKLLSVGLARRALTTLILAALGIAMTNAALFAAAAGPALSKAQKEAEAKGYIFVANHEAIVSKAKQEGKLRVIVSTDGNLLKHLAAGFKKKYPFIDIRTEEIRGTDAYIRQLHEIKSGLVKGQDVNDLAYDYYDEYPPFQKKFDILGMAEQKILQIPAQLVDAVNRNVVAIGSGIQVVAYNKKLIGAEKVPDTWEGFLKPEFSGRKFVLDIRPKDISALVPAWGLEKTLDFARKLAAQNPIWARGNTRVLTAMLAGEQQMLLGPDFDSVLRIMDKDKTNSIAYKLVEPVPVRLNEAQGILSKAENPYAALLWLEFVGSPAGQKILDERGPYEASVFIPGSVQERAGRGKKQSVVDWGHYNKIPEYERKIIEAYGFPRAQ